MLFLACDHVARTHNILVSANSFAAAFANANASPHRATKTRAILLECEYRAWFRDCVRRSESQIIIYANGIYEFSRIHFPIRDPDRFELAKCLDQLLSEHFVKEFTAGLPVTMLSGQ